MTISSHEMAKTTSEQFEDILRKQHPILLRDFTNIYIDEKSFNYVSTHPGKFRYLQATGSGLDTTWYYYHSPRHHKLFMIWISKTNHGFREDIERITPLKGT